MPMEMMRETPIPDPLTGVGAGPSHPEAPNEVILRADNIQGNSLAGFNKDFQAFLFLRITDVAQFKPSLVALADSISTLAEVVAFNRLFKHLRRRLGKDPTPLIKSTWTNIAFTAEGLTRLGIIVNPARRHESDDAFEDRAFRDGSVL